MIEPTTTTPESAGASVAAPHLRMAIGIWGNRDASDGPIPLVCSRTGSRRGLARKLGVDLGAEDVEVGARVGHDLGGHALAFA